VKVLDLQCAAGHTFEGWFGSEANFRDQLQRELVSCPLCGDAHITKLLSAPRLNLGSLRAGRQSGAGDPAASAPSPTADMVDAAAGEPARKLAQMKAAWWRAAREAVQSSEDVGDRFAEEARRIHHGDAEERGIRGRATGDEVRELMEEGVGILPLPDALKETLQ